MSQAYCGYCDSLIVDGHCVNWCRGKPDAIHKIKQARTDLIERQSNFCLIEKHALQHFDTEESKKIILDHQASFEKELAGLELEYSTLIHKDFPMAKEAARFNEGKPRLSYFKRSFQKMLEGIAWVKTFGANKYEEDNWRSGGKPDTEYWDSMDRHFDHFLSGEVYDQDSGCHHLAHACWNLCALLELNYPDVPMRDVAIYEDRMAHWAKVKADKEAAE